MKKLLVFVGMLLMASQSWAQNNNAKIESIAPYHILTTDSVYVTPANLKKNKAVMLIYFSPDCSHCQNLMKEMQPELKQFKNIQIVMITFMPMLKGIRQFRKDYGLTAYHNIILGTEGYTYLVQRYYQVRTTPFIALYDKKGKLVTTYEHPPKVSELVKEVKKV